VILLVFSIPAFTVTPIFGIEQTRVIISEIDDNIFKAALNSTIISTNGTVIGKLEITNPDKIGQVFVLEQKNKEKTNEVGLQTIAPIIAAFAAIGTAIGGTFKFYKEQQARNNLEFSKLLNDFEDKWTNARTDWKNSTQKDFASCYAMCAKRLSVLDSLAFLTESEKIDKKMLEYFKVHFSEGRLYVKWIFDVEHVEKDAWGNFSTYVKKMKPTPSIAPVKFLPVEFHTIYKEKTGNDFKDD